MHTTGIVILVVDDEEKDLLLLQAHLEPRGYTVITAQSGQEIGRASCRERV